MLDLDILGLAVVPLECRSVVKGFVPILWLVPGPHRRFGAIPLVNLVRTGKIEWFCSERQVGS